MELSSKQLFETNVADFTLYPHQANAVQWMRMIEYNVGNPNTMKGGALCDGMGLGKTMESVALVAANPVPSTLVLCPPSTRFEWINHFLKCIKDITIYTIEGEKYYKCVFVTNSEGIQEIDQVPLNKKKGEEFIEPAILICNYQLISNGTKNNKLVTEKVWYRIMVDEAHFLRNQTDTWYKLNELKQPMITTNGITHRFGTRWCITGTPIQMGKQDLVNIFKFIDNRFLSGKTEREWDNELRMLIGSNLFRRNSNQLSPFMKKFMKFPESEPIVHNIKVTMDDTQLSNFVKDLSYEYIVQKCKEDRKLVDAILYDEKAFMIVKTTEAKYYNMKSTTGSFTESEEFRNMISYPYGFAPMFMSQLYPGVHHSYKGKMSKLEKFKELLMRKKGKSFIVFHHYDGIAQKIEELIQMYFIDYTILKINGKVTSDRERFNIVQKANRLIDQGRPVILISSIKATSEGLNYQKFNMIIKFDPEYNQKTEEQAEARVQRIGQVNQVEIFEISLDDFQGYYGVISVDRRIQNIRDERTHLSDIIDEYNAAFTFKRYYFLNPNGVRESGIFFGNHIESIPKGSLGACDSVGPSWIK